MGQRTPYDYQMLDACWRHLANTTERPACTVTMRTYLELLSPLVFSRSPTVMVVDVPERSHPESRQTITMYRQPCHSPILSSFPHLQFT